MGKDVARVVEVFPGENYREIDGLAWFGFSCQDADGERYVIPGGVKSFSIQSKAESANNGKCWVHAEYGSAASTVYKGCFAAVMAAAFSGLFLTM